LPSGERGGIEVRDVTKSFGSGPGAVTALEGVSLTVAPGRATVLIGASGCGKSTLLNIFAGLDRPTSGSVLVNGGDASRGSVGMMFQKSSLQPWRTVLQNVMLPAELLGLDKTDMRERAHNLLEMVGLAKWVNRYPSELSGGMQQRVALARVLLPDPGIILLDEPFGALDEMTRETLDLEMRRIVETTGKTLVMVTHSIYEAVLVADTVAVLSPHPGRLVATIDVELAEPRTVELTEHRAFSDSVTEVRRALRERKEAAA
jgi:NitT/TauT family transport system ATP-binding protein